MRSAAHDGSMLLDADPDTFAEFAAAVSARSDLAQARRVVKERP